MDLQVATNFGGPSPVASELIYSVLSSGSYRKHMEGLHSRLATLRSDTAARLSDLGIIPWLMPRGGFYLWCTLPEGVDSADLARAALTEKMVLAPGNVFSVPQSMASLMRFNVSQMQDPQVFETLGRVQRSVQSGTG